MKKILCSFLATFAIFATSIISYGATGKIIDDKTFVPVRGVFEELGFTVTYDNINAIATIKDANYTITIPKNKTYFSVNGKAIIPESPQTIVDNSMYLPLRAIGDSIGAKINWNAETKTAFISYCGLDSYVDCGNVKTILPNTNLNKDTSLKTFSSNKIDVSIPEFADATNSLLMSEYYGKNCYVKGYNITKVTAYKIDKFFQDLTNVYNFKTNDDFVKELNESIENSCTKSYFTEDGSKILVYTYDDKLCLMYVFEDPDFDMNYTSGKFFIGSDIFEGELKDCIPNGKGCLIFDNIGKYEGNFVNGKREGKGTFSWNDGDKYEGNWKNDKMNGSGKYTFSSGKVLDGQWKDNKFVK